MSDSNTNDPTSTNNNNTTNNKENTTFFTDQLQIINKKCKEFQETSVIWFPKNDLASPEKPFLGTGEIFEFETLPLHEANKRIYEQDFDFEKYLSHQLESSSMALACSFFLGALLGGFTGFFNATNEVNTNVKQYQGQLLDNATRAKIYNDGAHLIRKRVLRSAVSTGIKFSLLAGSYGIVNYQVIKYRRKSDPLNFTAGGTAFGMVGGFLNNGTKGMVIGGLIMGGIGLGVGGLVEVVHYLGANTSSYNENK